AGADGEVGTGSHTEQPAIHVDVTAIGSTRAAIGNVVGSAPTPAAEDTDIGTVPVARDIDDARSDIGSLDDEVGGVGGRNEADGSNTGKQTDRNAIHGIPS